MKTQTLLSGKTSMLFLTLFFFFTVTKMQASQQDEITVFEQIITNVQKMQQADANVATVVADTENYLKTIGANGAFPDVEYTSTAQTNWPPIAHMNRMKPMVLAYVMPESSYYGDEELYNTIVAMLQYWYTVNPTSTNWFNWGIAWPERMGVILCLMRGAEKQVPTTLETQILTRMGTLGRPDQSGSQGIGANKMDIALHWIYRCSLQKDKTNLDFAVNQFYMPMTFNLGEGLQHDYSYLQHGMQLYIGGYGNSVLTAMTKAAFYLENTEYEAAGEKLDLVSSFVRKAYIPTIRGKYMLYNAKGRGLASKNGISQAGFIPLLQKMILLDPDYEKEYEEAISRINGSQPADYEIEDYHTHFWRGDYTLHQRKGYTVDVRMGSAFTGRNENGNGENLKGFFLTDGATQIAIDGDEYVDIFPVWDWTKIPGTTAPAMTIPRPAQWNNNSEKAPSTFVGGVSAGLYGVTTYYHNDYTYGVNSEARKSYFFFDKEIVCLGAGIKSTNASQINTTLNQTLLSGDVNYVSKDGTTTALATNSTVVKNSLSFIHHDQTAYFFPESEAGNILISNKAQSGTWNSISSNNGDASTITKDVFTAYFNHGIKPTDASYSYIIVPNLNSVDAAKDYPISNVMVLANNEAMQAVINLELGMLGIVFYEAATFEYGDISIKSSAGCAVMCKNVLSEEIEVFIADPTRKEKQVTLILMNHPLLGSKELICDLDNSDAYGGSTHEFVVDKNTLDYIHIPVTGIELDKTQANLSPNNRYASLKATIEPENAREQTIIWSSSDENVVKISESGEVIAYNEGTATVTATTKEGGFSKSCEITVDALMSSLVLADSWVYDSSSGKTTNYGKTTTLTVKKDNSGYQRQAFFRFSIADLDNVENLNGAKVWASIFAETAGTNAHTAIWYMYGVDNITWGENTITWDNKPAEGSLVAQKQCIKTNNATFKSQYVVDFDITSYALAEYAKGKKEVSFMVTQNIRVSDGSGTTTFASKEHADELRHPRTVISFQKETGTENILPEEIAIYPTVTSGLVYVAINEPATIQVFNLNGQLLQSIPAVAGTTELNLSSFSSGMYLIKAGAAYKKVIKQ